MKIVKVSYYLGVSLSFLIGFAHFFAPLMFQWYDYLPMQYENLIVGIDYTNLCFSFLLSGLSLLLLINGKKVLSGDKNLLTFFGFLTATWAFRSGLAVIHPWPLDPIPSAAIGQLVGTFVELALLAFPFVYILRKKS